MLYGYRCSLVVDRRSVLWVEVDGRLDKLMTLILKLLPHSNLTSIQTLSIMTVDWLRGERPWGGRERDGKEGGKRKIYAVDHGIFVVKFFSSMIFFDEN